MISVRTFSCTPPTTIAATTSTTPITLSTVISTTTTSAAPAITTTTSPAPIQTTTTATPTTTTAASMTTTTVKRGESLWEMCIRFLAESALEMRMKHNSLMIKNAIWFSISSDLIRGRYSRNPSYNENP